MVKVIGITGGIASGKSAVANYFRERGATVLDADKIAHQCLELPDVVVQLESRWGAAVLDDDRLPIRREIARKVFDTAQGEAELQWLESVIHPLVRERLEEALRDLQATAGEQPTGASERAIVILDVPLLLERGWNRYCDAVLFVDASLEERRKRAAERGWDSDELAKREQRQWEVSRKREAADCTVQNNSDLPALHAQLRQIEAAQFCGP